MWKSRQAAVRQVEGVPFQAAIETIKAEGFEEQTVRDDRALLKRRGTKFTVKGTRTPLKLALVQQPEGGLELRLRYDTFVLFDTGDLEDTADQLVAAVGGGAAAVT